VVTHKAMRPYARLIGDRALELTIVTAFPTKADRLRADLQVDRTDVPIRVHVVDELRELIAPLPNPRPTHTHSSRS
jgi:hypothetical protein